MKQIEQSKRVERFVILYRLSYISAVFAALLMAALTILTSTADPARVTVAYRGMPEAVIMTVLGLGAAALLGVGLWLWVAEDRIVTG